jgi:hypothetical protein
MPRRRFFDRGYGVYFILSWWRDIFACNLLCASVLISNVFSWLSGGWVGGDKVVVTKAIWLYYGE